MRKIDSLSIIDDNQVKRTVSFWHGNPADASADDPVDLIIVSAFRNDYTPTSRSIIGALHRKGLSVADLAQDKAVDLRETAGFWLSRPLPAAVTPVGVGRILCFEPHFLGPHSAEVVGGLFRGLFSFLPEGQETRISMIDPGKVWQDAIDVAMQSCRKMVAALTPSYFKSVECKEEINMARLRHQRQDQSFLLPLYVRSLENDAELPLWLQTVAYIDCRETDKTKLTAVADRLAAGSVLQ